MTRMDIFNIFVTSAVRQAGQVVNSELSLRLRILWFIYYSSAYLHNINLLFQTFQSRTWGRKTSSTIWHGGWTSNMGGIWGIVGCNNISIYCPAGSLQDWRLHFEWGGGSSVADERRGIQEGRWQSSTKMVRKFGLQRQECVAAKFACLDFVMNDCPTWDMISISIFLDWSCCIEMWGMIVQRVTWFPVQCTAWFLEWGLRTLNLADADDIEPALHFWHAKHSDWLQYHASQLFSLSLSNSKPVSPNQLSFIKSQSQLAIWLIWICWSPNWLRWWMDGNQNEYPVLMPTLIMYCSLSAYYISQTHDDATSLIWQFDECICANCALVFYLIWIWSSDNAARFDLIWQFVTWLSLHCAQVKCKRPLRARLFIIIIVTQHSANWTTCSDSQGVWSKMEVT